jgi:hypothetical protein
MKPSQKLRFLVNTFEYQNRTAEIYLQRYSILELNIFSKFSVF